MDQMYYCTCDSSVGRIGIIFTCDKIKPRIIRVTLPSEKLNTWINRICPGMKKHDCPRIMRVQKKIRAYLDGRTIRLPLDLVDWRRTGAFQKRVLLMEYRIPRGRVSTYGRLAKKLKNPGAARAVGNALSRNPFPLLIPCHRAVRCDGSLGGFRGGVRLKKRLLEMEGIKFDNAGRVVDNHFW